MRCRFLSSPGAGNDYAITPANKQIQLEPMFGAGRGFGRSAPPPIFQATLPRPKAV
jgi:hypothetical protein